MKASLKSFVVTNLRVVCALRLKLASETFTIFWMISRIGMARLDSKTSAKHYRNDEPPSRFLVWVAHVAPESSLAMAHTHTCHLFDRPWTLNTQGSLWKSSISTEKAWVHVPKAPWKRISNARCGRRMFRMQPECRQGSRYSTPLKHSLRHVRWILET